MRKNLESTRMEQLYKEFKGVVPCHSADVRSRDEKENSGYHPVNPASYRLNNPTIEIISPSVFIFKNRDV